MKDSSCLGGPGLETQQGSERLGASLKRQVLEPGGCGGVAEDWSDWGWRLPPERGPKRLTTSLHTAQMTPAHLRYPGPHKCKLGVLPLSCRLEPSGHLLAHFPFSPHPCGDSSLLDQWDAAEIGNYYEFFAAALGNLEWLRFCLNSKHNVILKDGKGFTAIHFAAQNGKLASLQVLIEEYQFPVDLPTNNGQTPLHLVIQRDKTMTLPCVLYLLQEGAALNAETCNGSTPLHLAAREGLLSCVKVLVQNGANIYAQDAMGRKPIDYCIIWNYRDCARFLKDAMWKQEKKDFAHEMRKLKKLKDQLALMEYNYLIEYQKEHQIVRESDLKKWLHRKLLQQYAEHQPRAQPCALPQVVTRSKTPKHQGLSPPKSFHLSPEAHLRQILQCKPQPLVKPISLNTQPTVTRPMVWNFSNNPARSPTTQINYPQGIRLGVHPDPSLERDLSSFLEVRSDGHGGATLHTVAGDQVAPLPRLPFEVIVHTLCPSVQPERMKVPQGFCSVSMKDVPLKRHWDNTFWTDTLAMNLRETFDEAFLAALGTRQRVSTLPSPKTPP